MHALPICWAAGIWASMFELGPSIFEKAFRAILVYLFLLVLLRLFGKRELAQLNPFDLVVLLSLSNTLQNAIIGDDTSVTGGMIGAFTLCGFNYLVVRFVFRHRRLDQIIEGKPVVLVKVGQVQNHAMARELITRAELHGVIRRQGFARIEDVETCTIEPDGSFTVEGKKPSPADQQHGEILDRLDALARQVEELKAQARLVELGYLEPAGQRSATIPGRTRRRMPMRVGIIGAGIAGLTLALRLVEEGHFPSILDKGRGVGGRARDPVEAKGSRSDHGAQYFTVRDPGFRAFLDRHVPVDALAVWDGRFASLEGGRLVPESPETPRLVGVPGMNAIAKALAAPLEVQTGVTIARLKRVGASWFLVDDLEGSHGPFDWVVATAPPSQSAALLRGWTGIAAEAEAVAMRPCFALMVETGSDVALPADGIRCDHPILGWVADNRSKPGRGPSPALVIQSNHDWAEAHRNDDRAAVARTLREAAEEAFGIELGLVNSEALHRWLYAKPVRPLGKPCLVDGSAKLAICGDWCQAAKIEGAFLSGMACAEALIGGIN